jgi:hypothetical protein
MATTRQLIPLATSASANFTSETIDAETLPISYITSNLSLHFLVVGISSNIKFTLFISNDGINFAAAANQEIGNGNAITNFPLASRYFRIAIIPQSNTAGTVSCAAYIK